METKIQRWTKQGNLFSVPPGRPWMLSHAQIPVVDVIEPNLLRIYFGTRDAENRTSTGLLEVRADDPSKPIYLSEDPILAPGKLGGFDDCGAMPSCIVTHNGLKFLYYIGWNRRTTIPYHNSIGLAVSEDGGRTFERLFDGPIMDRTHVEPYFVATPCVVVEGTKWRMWYAGCTDWTMVHGIVEPKYQIKYAESDDGIIWRRENQVCIDYRSETEANCRPCVMRRGQKYCMWYCYRDICDYRTDRQQGYRMGYAESANGIEWTRMDSCANLEPSAEGWDSEMIAYPYLFKFRNRLHVLYNGNGFGKSGFGLAVAEDEELIA